MEAALIHFSAEKAARWFYSPIFFFLLASLPLQGDVVAILACDTQALNIESPVQNDLAMMREEARKIALYTDQHLQELIFSGEDLDPKHFIQTIQSLEFTQDDSVIFFFSGHGYRTTAKDDNVPWPNLFFSQSGYGVDYAKVLTILKEKNHRFLLAIADCCNNFMPENAAPPLFSKGLHLRKLSSRQKKNYKKLFRKKGSVVTTSSDVGDFSWCTEKGALFTLALFDLIELEASKKGSPSWKKILHETSSRIMRFQTPVYEIVTR